MEKDLLENMLGSDNSEAVDDNSIIPYVNWNDLDQISEERSTANMPSRTIFLRCILTASFLVFVTGSVMSFVSVGLIYFDFTFMNQCIFVAWHEIPERIQLVHLFTHCFSDQLILFWPTVTLCSVFPLKGKKKELILQNALAGCVCTIYRLSTYVYGIYGKSKMLSSPQYLTVAIMVFASSWLVATDYCCVHLDKLKLCVKLAAQFIFLLIISPLYRYFFFLVYYATSNDMSKMILAGFAPILGFVGRIISKQALLTVNACFHPGKMYILCCPLYTVATLFYRIIQANIESTTSFLMLSVFHAFTSFMQRMAAVYGKDVFLAVMSFFVKYKYRRELKRPKIKRVTADFVIVGIVFEVWGILVTNCILLIYALLHRIPLKDGSAFRMDDQWKSFLFRTCSAVFIEYVFICSAVLILTLKSNMPISRIWWRNWKQITVVIMVNAIFATLLLSSELAMFTQKSFEMFLLKRGDESLANTLSPCNNSTVMYR